MTGDTIVPIRSMLQPNITTVIQSLEIIAQQFMLHGYSNNRLIYAEKKLGFVFLSYR